MNIKNWLSLNTAGKEKYIQEIICKQQVPFELKGMQKFEQNKTTLETFILLFEDKEFVFVPGAENIILGWDTNNEFSSDMLKTYEEEWAESCEYYKNCYAEIEEDYRQQIDDAKNTGQNEALLLDEMNELLEMQNKWINKTFSQYMEEIYNHMQKVLSPVRSTSINAMIVERDCNCRTIASLSNSEMASQMMNTPFSILTEDEWEYLCGGGSRTFFRWGNTLSDVKDEMFENISEGQEIIRKPNMFGLNIQYMTEITSQDHLYKGGDGGCSLCGGDGLQYLSVAYSTFYRHTADYKVLSLPYRRIIRL